MRMTAIEHCFLFQNRHQADAMGSVPRGLSSPVVTPTNDFLVPQDDWSLVSKIAVASLTSQGTMGGLLVGGLLLKVGRNQQFVCLFMEAAPFRIANTAAP